MLENIQALGLLTVSVLMLVMMVVGQRKIMHLQQQLKQIDILKNDIQGLFAGAVGGDSRIYKLETRTRRIVERQEQLENSKHAERPYEQAIRMVHQGSKVEDLMAVCKLSRGEADLIMMVHGTEQTEEDISGQFH
jgi:hypothetical protein